MIQKYKKIQKYKEMILKYKEKIQKYKERIQKYKRRIENNEICDLIFCMVTIPTQLKFGLVDLVWYIKSSKLCLVAN